LELPSIQELKSSGYHLVLYCNSYGGFGLRGALKQEFERRIAAIDIGEPLLWSESDSDDHDVDDGYYETRAHPMLIDMFFECFDTISHEHCQFGLAAVPVAFAKYVTIDEYDGWEHVEVDLDKYKVAKVAECIDIEKTTTTVDVDVDLVASIRAVLNTPPPNIRLFLSPKY
jgi:hypothetical protein